MTRLLSFQIITIYFVKPFKIGKKSFEQENEEK
jgi:hypothetical protein